MAAITKILPVKPGEVFTEDYFDCLVTEGREGYWVYKAWRGPVKHVAGVAPSFWEAVGALENAVTLRSAADQALLDNVGTARFSR